MVGKLDCHVFAPPVRAQSLRRAAMDGSPASIGFIRFIERSFFRRRSVSQRPFWLSILFDAKVCRLLLKNYNRLLCQQIFKGMLNSGSRLIA
jgi:hypothetical protein